jgi:formate dehydrogenase (coenzyme F420) beta subunit
VKNSYEKMTEDIQKIAAEILREEKVARVIGYGKEEYTGEISPIFITRPEESKELLFNDKCGMILAKYLLKEPEKKTGIVAKPCDTRVIASYLSEKLLKRENLVIIGINGCQGIEGNTACNECSIRNPVISDYTVGEPAEEKETKQKNDLEGMTREERMGYFQDEFSRCIRCYACRDACPICYCEECFVDSNQPFWLGSGTNLKDNFTFHLMRSMHMAGRCVNCGACELACPEGIDVRALTARLYRAAKEIYNYEPGMDPEQKTLLTDYSVNDPQPGFLEGV